MSIKESLEVLLNPQYLKPILLLIAIVMLFRNMLYLGLSDVTRMFEWGPQEVVQVAFDTEIPRLLMTVLWPLVFAALNRILDNVKLAPKLFYGALGVHAITCLIAVFIIYTEGCFTKETTLLSGEVVIQGCNKVDFNSTVYGGALLTLLSVVVSHYIYSTKSLFLLLADNNENA